MRIKKFMWLGIIPLVILVIILGFFIHDRIQSVQTYRIWQDDLSSALNTLPTSSYGYLRCKGQELFFLKFEDGTMACGKKDIAAGTEALYFDNQVYTYSGEDTAPSIADANTQEKFNGYVQEIVETVQLFSDSTIKGAKPLPPQWFENSAPFLSMESWHTVIFQLDDKSDAFQLTPDSFAHLSCSLNGISNFVYNYTPATPDVPQVCLLLQIGSSNGELMGWSGHQLP